MVVEKILLGVTGSVAVYKAVEIARTLFKKGREVKVIMSPFAKEFVSPLQFLSIGAKTCVSDFFEKGNTLSETHITLSDWADCFVVAPATAATIAKMSIGLADNLLVATFLAMGEKPVFIAPAMNTRMWYSNPVQRNIESLKKQGVNVIPPREGVLADGKTGKGPMAEVGEILERVLIFENRA